jgi:ABC-type branched-subunit amino acid transport system ATPase component
VLENVTVGSRDRRATGLAAALLGRPLMWRRERERWRHAVEALRRVGVDGLVGADVGSLSYGNRRLVELARAVCAEPDVLLLDEPSAGLNDSETESLGRLLADLNEQGLTIVMVDHKIDFVDRVCHRIVVMETGRAIAHGTPAEVWADPRVVDAYLGVSDAAGG